MSEIERVERERKDEADYYVEETEIDEHETLTEDDIDHGVYNERQPVEEESWSGGFILRKGKKQVRLPTQDKTKLTTCPRCSKREYSKKLARCRFCKLQLFPNREFTIRTALELALEQNEKKS